VVKTVRVFFAVNVYPSLLTIYLRGAKKKEAKKETIFNPNLLTFIIELNKCFHPSNLRITTQTTTHKQLSKRSDKVMIERKESVNQSACFQCSFFLSSSSS